MPSGFKENAEDLNTGDSVQVDVNPPDVEAIRGRLDAATPGPWHKDDGDFGCVTIGDYGWTTPPGVNAPEYDVDSPQGHADAELIAHAPTDLRRLLDENARLNAELADFREMAVLNTKAHTEALERARVERDRAINECDDWETKYAELSVERDALRRALPAAPEMPRPPAQERAGDAGTPGTGSGRGTGLAEPHGAQADLSLIPADLIKSDLGIRGGEPCITGTRIPVHEVAGYLADGATWEEVREMLPSLPSLPVPSTEKGPADEH